MKPNCQWAGLLIPNALLRHFIRLLRLSLSYRSGLFQREMILPMKQLQYRRHYSFSHFLTEKKNCRMVYTSSAERTKHYRFIESIAELAHRPVPAIAPLYEEILAEMKSKAQIPDFLPIFVSKRVRQILNV